MWKWAEGKGRSEWQSGGVECEDGQWHSGNLALFQSTRRPKSEKKKEKEKEKEASAPLSFFSGRQYAQACKWLYSSQP